MSCIYQPQQLSIEEGCVLFSNSVLVKERLRWCRTSTKGTLRSQTATSTKTSSQNINLLYHKSLVIIPSRSRHTLLAKYPENELVREILRWKKRMKDSQLHAHVVVKTSNFTSSLCRGSKNYLLKSVRHVQHDYLWFFNQLYYCFVTLLLPSPS